MLRPPHPHHTNRCIAACLRRHPHASTSQAPHKQPPPSAQAQGGEAWDTRAKIACQALSAIQQLTHLVPRAEGAQEALLRFLQAATQVLKALTAHSLSGAPLPTQVCALPGSSPAHGSCAQGLSWQLL